MQNNIEELYKALMDFLEYEEALTNDKESAARIRNFLKKIGLWDV